MEDPVITSITMASEEAYAAVMQETACTLTSMINLSEGDMAAPKRGPAKEDQRCEGVGNFVVGTSFGNTEDNLVIPKLVLKTDFPTPCQLVLPPPSDKENASVEELEESAAAGLISTQTTPVSETAPGEHVIVTPSEPLISHAEAGIQYKFTEQEPIAFKTDEQLTLNASQLTIERQFTPQVTSKCSS
ncbi:hypothetical protein R1flu_010886 [Riccia fluitans]|uniref:Uncharacterized protein n=1 Tax=Riccia fluitans TaxID=41844 RepID=A0ABD1Z7B4_9MARC